MQHSNTDSCILLKFYIKPQPETTIKTIGESCILLKFYIKPQPLVGAIAVAGGCILSKFYIKPQLLAKMAVTPARCILSKFYIKPQPPLRKVNKISRCILSKFYIKPQRLREVKPWSSVVSYRNSTSNHNSGVGINATMSLYLIEILHQTTTRVCCLGTLLRCILSKFYIKPQRTSATSD